MSLHLHGRKKKATKFHLDHIFQIDPKIKANLQLSDWSSNVFHLCHPLPSHFPTVMLAWPSMWCTPLVNVGNGWGCVKRKVWHTTLSKITPSRSHQTLLLLKENQKTSFFRLSNCYFCGKTSWISQVSLEKMEFLLAWKKLSRPAKGPMER